MFVSVLYICIRIVYILNMFVSVLCLYPYCIYIEHEFPSSRIKNLTENMFSVRTCVIIDGKHSHSPGNYSKSVIDTESHWD